MIEEDIRHRAIILSLVGLSVIIALFTFIVSLINKYFKQFLSELMIMVLISEIIYGSTRFMSLTREEVFQKLNEDYTSSLIQLICGVFCDTWTLLANLFICMTISDSIVNKAKYSDKKKIKIASRIIILTLSFIITLIFTLLQVLKYKDDEEKVCNLLSCELNSKIHFYLLLILIILTIAIIVTMFIPICFLSRKKRRISTLEIGYQAESKIKKMQYKLIIFPIVNVVFWGWKLIHQFIKIVAEETNINPVYLWFYSIINSFRGTIYALMYIISHDELRLRLKKAICPCCKNDKEDDIIMEIPAYENEDDINDEDYDY